MSFRQIAEEIGVTTSAIHKWLARGKLTVPVYRFGTTLRVRRSDFDQYVAASRITPAPASDPVTSQSIDPITGEGQD
jgi:excisionase family DNA binding protein